jgi:hypothetical protein
MSPRSMSFTIHGVWFTLLYTVYCMALAWMWLTAINRSDCVSVEDTRMTVQSEHRDAPREAVLRFIMSEQR